MTSIKEFLKVPVEKLKTGGTKFRLLEVRVFNTGRRIHNTAPIPAMGETEAVTQFMQRDFFHSRHEETRVWRLAIKLGQKPVYGDDRALTFYLCHTKHILEDRHVNVKTGDCNESQAVMGMALKEMPQNQFRIILSPGFIIGIPGGGNLR